MFVRADVGDVKRIFWEPLGFVDSTLEDPNLWWQRSRSRMLLFKVRANGYSKLVELRATGPGQPV